VEIGRIWYACGEMVTTADAVAIAPAPASRITYPYVPGDGGDHLHSGRVLHSAELRLDELGISPEPAYWRGGDGDQRGPGDASGIGISVGGFIFADAGNIAFSGSIQCYEVCGGEGGGEVKEKRYLTNGLDNSS
jgi:hypothetical protein